MTRTILAGLAVSVFAVALSGTGCQSTGIGDPCTPEQEFQPSFQGFDELEVNSRRWIRDFLAEENFAQRFTAGDTSVFYPSLGRYVQDKLVPEPSTDTMAVPSLTIQYDLGWADMTSVTSYFFRQNANTSDGTYFNSDFIQFLADTSSDLGSCQCGAAFTGLPGPSYSHEQTETTSQELRFASKLPQVSGIPISWPNT